MLATLPGTQDALRARWEAGTVAWRRSLVSAMVEEVTVLPANGKRLFSSERVGLRWRG